jgi:copper ion binding protein
MCPSNYACSPAPAHTDTHLDTETSTSASRDSYTVIGMTCNHCVMSVTEEVGAIDGVTDVTVDLPTGRVDVTTDHTVTTDQVRQAVEEAGYQLA